MRFEVFIDGPGRTMLLLCALTCVSCSGGRAAPGSTAGAGEAMVVAPPGGLLNTAGMAASMPAADRSSVGAAGAADKPRGSGAAGNMSRLQAGALSAAAPAGPVGQAGAEPPPPPPSAARPNDWRMMGFDEKNWFFNPNEKAITVDNAKDLTVKWRFTVMGLPIGSPIIAEGKVFAMTSVGTYAIDFETGKQIWFRDDIMGSAALAYGDGYVYVHKSPAPPAVFKLRAADGSTVWGPIKNCRDDSSCSGESSPILVGDTVLVGMEHNLAEASFNAGEAKGKRGGVRALDAETGALRWLYSTVPEASPTGEDGASVWSTVSVDVTSGRVFATTGNNYTAAGPNGDAFHAFDLMTGTKQWVHQVHANDVFTVSDGVFGDNSKQDYDFGANPILAVVNGQAVVAAGDKSGAFYELDRETGALRWLRDDLSPSHDATYGGIFINGAFDGRAYYVIANDPRGGGAVLHRLDPGKRGESTWSRQLPEATWGAAALANGVLFAPNNATLHVLNAETGEVLKQIDAGGSIGGGSPAIAQGRVVIKSGFIYVDPRTKLNDQIICYALPGDAAMGAAGSGSPPAAGSGAPAMPTLATFSAVYQSTIVGGACNSGQCHTAAAAGGLDLSTQPIAFKNLVNVEAMGRSSAASPGACGGSGLRRVVPGDPDHSLLVSKLEHTQTCGGPMPNAGTTLPAAQLQQVRAWIAAGAKND